MDMRRYTNDPRIITVKYSGRCKTCNSILHRGHEAVYWPSTRSLICLSCGEHDYLESLSHAADEEVYHGRGNPLA